MLGWRTYKPKLSRRDDKVGRRGSLNGEIIVKGIQGHVVP